MAKKTFKNKENLDEVKTDLPSSRFQTEKKVLGPDELGVTSSSIPGTEDLVTTSNVTPDTAKKVKSKISIRPSVSVEELNNKQVGGVPLAGNLNSRSVAGFTSHSGADDVSKIPYSEGKYRPDTRYGKKRSEELFEMDNTISEQIVPTVDDSLDLREAPDAKQGYNGRKQFKQTRGKKNFTFKTAGNRTLSKLPQQLLNDASVDFIETDKLVYASGQMITSNMDAKANYPTINAVNPEKPAAIEDPMTKANYMPKSLIITVADGKISDVKIDEDKFEVAADPIARDQANMNWQLDSNNVTKSMIRLQKELGRETTDKWSPLGYVISQPYEYNMLMHDIEASTGALAAISYRAAVSSLAFQRNILAKDGVNPQKNAVKMMTEGFLGSYANSNKDSFPNTTFKDVIFNKEAYRMGSAAGLINMFDSISKYRTKADILGMQRSLTMHLSQAANNINPFRCKPEFLKAVDKAHMFSTIDGNYNPMLPIFSTRKMNVMLPLSLNYFLKDWKHPSTLTSEDLATGRRDPETGTLTQYVYSYKDIRNNYTTKVQHPFIEGLLHWLLKHEGAFCSTFGNGTVTIPFEFNMQAPGLLPFLVCSASQDIAFQRNISFRDILFAGEQENYIWDDLVSLKDADPLKSTQLTIGSYNEALKLGKLAPDTAIRELWNGQMQLSDTDSNGAQYFLPWYFNEHAFDATAGGSYTQNEGFFNEPSAFNMSIPSIRDGVRHEYIDVIKGMSERDVRLSLDRWITLPLFRTKEDKGYCTAYAPVTTSSINTERISLGTVRYDGNSDGRLVAYYKTAGLLETDYEFDEKSLYCIPKEIGYIDDLIQEEVVVNSVTGTEKDQKFTVNVTTLECHNFAGGSNGAYYNGSNPMRLVSYRVEADSSESGSISRSASLNQVFYRYFANEDANSINTVFISKTGIVPCISYKDGSASEEYAIFNLDSTTESSKLIDNRIRTLASRIWTIVQRFFIPINRFENSFTLNNTKHSYDPLETSFYFGVCGTLASDFTQDILERLDIYDQLGIDYTEDIFVKESLIFR